MTMSTDKVGSQAHEVVLGEGLAVFMVHGMGVDHRSLMVCEPAWEGLPLRRIYVDLPGFGFTPALPGMGGLSELCDWLAQYIAGVCPDGEPFAMVGNSMGGALAREMVARMPHRVCGLALIAPVTQPRRSLRRLAKHHVSQPDPAWLDSLPPADVADFLTMGVNRSFAAWRRYQRFILPGIRTFDREAYERLDARYWMPRDPELSFGVFERPTLIVTGRQDQVVGYEDQRELAERHYPNAVVAELDPAGHNVHIDRSDDVIDVLRDWGRRVVASQ